MKDDDEKKTRKNRVQPLVLTNCLAVCAANLPSSPGQKFGGGSIRASFWERIVMGRGMKGKLIWRMGT